MYKKIQVVLYVLIVLFLSGLDTEASSGKCQNDKCKGDACKIEPLNTDKPIYFAKEPDYPYVLEINVLDSNPRKTAVEIIFIEKRSGKEVGRTHTTQLDITGYGGPTSSLSRPFLYSVLLGKEDIAIGWVSPPKVIDHEKPAGLEYMWTTVNREPPFEITTNRIFTSFIYRIYE